MVKIIVDYLLAQPLSSLIWGVGSTLFFIYAFYLLWTLHRNPNYKNFNLTHLVMTDDLSRISGSRARILVAFIVASWGYIHLVLTEKLTEWYLAAYLAAFVADRISSRIINKKEDTTENDTDTPTS